MKESLTALTSSLILPPSSSVLSYDDIDETTGDDDRLDDLLALSPRANSLVGQRRRARLIFARVGADGDATAQLAVDLHGDLQFVLARELLVKLRPARIIGQKAARVTESLPHLLRDVRTEGREHQDQRLQTLAHGEQV